MASQDWFDKDFYAVLGVAKDVSDAELKKVYRKLAPWAMAGSIGLLALVLVPGLGKEVNGNRNWLSFGGPFELPVPTFSRDVALSLSRCPTP